MAHNFSSVEWLSQSSLKKKTTFSSPYSHEIRKDDKTTAYFWSPVIQPFSKVAQVSPYPGTQQLALSPSLWDSDLSNQSSDYEVSPCTLESTRLSPVLPCADLPQEDMEASQSPLYNGLYTKSENIFFHDVQKSTSSQDIPTLSQERSERPTEQKNLNQDLTHSGKLFSIFMNNLFLFLLNHNG